MQLKQKALNLKLKISSIAIPFMVMLLNVKTYATSTIGTQEVETATQNIRDAVIKLAMPVGSVLMFVSIVIIAIKLIVNANNPNKRSEGFAGAAKEIRRIFRERGEYGLCRGCDNQYAQNCIPVRK